jgi:hypothetical protein
MFCVSLIPLTPFFPLVLNFAHRGFTVCGRFQERNPRELRGVPVEVFQTCHPVNLMRYEAISYCNHTKIFRAIGQ